MKNINYIIFIIIAILFTSCTNDAIDISSSPKTLQESEQPQIIAHITDQEIQIQQNIDGSEETSHNTSNNESESTNNNETQKILTRTNTDVRNTKWGDNIDTVKQYETAELYSESNNELIYLDYILNTNIFISYYFDPNYGLYEIDYGLLDSYTNPSLYITQYDKYKKTISEKFGQPYSDDIIDNMDMLSILEPSICLYLGYIKYVTRWEVNNTHILLGMMENNNQINLIIVFTDKDYKETITTDGF